MKAYKAFWVDSERQLWSLMAQADDWFKEDDQYIKRPILYTRDGVNTQVMADMRPYLFAYKTKLDAVTNVVASFFPKLDKENGWFVPNPTRLKKDSEGNRVKGHIEIWEVEVELYDMPQVDWREHKKLPADVFHDVMLAKGYPDTLFCTSVKLVKKIKNF